MKVLRARTPNGVLIAASVGLLVAACTGEIDPAQSVVSTTGPYTPTNSFPQEAGTLAPMTTTGGPVWVDADQQPNPSTTGASQFPATSTTSGPDATVPVDAGPPQPTCDEALAAGVTLDEVAVYQALKIPIARGGEAVAVRNAPVVQGRAGLIRAYVSAQPGVTPHPIKAVLRLLNGSEETVYEASGMPATSSIDEASLSSTFNFEFAAEDVGPETLFSVSLEEASCAEAGGEPEQARFPATGHAPLDAVETGTLHVALVPIRYTGNTFASPSEADVSDSLVERYRSALLRMYPVTGVEVRVREALEWDSAVTATGNGWPELLQAILNLQEREAAPGEYYYGLLATRSTFESYCAGGCVAGMAPVPETGGFAGGPRATGGLGIGYDNSIASDTIVHELGHAHGRLHAPCVPSGGSLDGVDPEFPYEDARVGVWGYDIVDKQLKAPSGDRSHADVMSYCEPVWVSDYTYSGIAEWVSSVNGTGPSPRILTPKSLEPREPWLSMLLYADGSARWGSWQPMTPPGGSPEQAVVLDADGAELTQIDIVRMSLSESDTTYLFLPQTEPGWESLVLADGQQIRFGDVLPVSH